MARSFVRTTCLIGSLIAFPLGAQDKPRESQSSAAIPMSAQPPAGLCRVWLKDVPAGQQPAPTDCVTAIRNRPANAQVLFGEPRGDASAARGSIAARRNPVVRAPESPAKATAPVPRFAGPPAGAGPPRTVEPSGGRSSTVGTTGTPRPIDPPPPSKVPEKPEENLRF